MQRWEPSADWRERHTSAELLYAVCVRYATPTAADTAWRHVASLHRESDGEILAGGAALRRLAGDRIEAVSAGEDALDSLEDSVGELLAAAQRHGLGEAQVVREVRETLE